jgi:predicted nucleic acid-binding protein
VIVLDASVLIAHLDERDALHSRAEAALTDNASHPLTASPLTVAEVLDGPARVGRTDDAIGVLRALGITEVPFPEDASRRLAELRARTGLKLPDCCALLAADAASADAVLSFDDRLRGRSNPARLPDRLRTASGGQSEMTVNVAPSRR